MNSPIRRRTFGAGVVLDQLGAVPVRSDAQQPRVVQNAQVLRHRRAAHLGKRLGQIASTFSQFANTVGIGMYQRPSNPTAMAINTNSEITRRILI